jgi:hypothetical protein
MKEPSAFAHNENGQVTITSQSKAGFQGPVPKGDGAKLSISLNPPVFLKPLCHIGLKSLSRG